MMKLRSAFAGLEAGLESLLRKAGKWIPLEVLIEYKDSEHAWVYED